MPVSLIVAANDTVCTPEKADVLSQQLSTLQHYYTLGGKDHLYFVNPEESMFSDLLISEIGSTLVDGPQSSAVDIQPDMASTLTASLAIFLVAFKFLF